MIEVLKTIERRTGFGCYVQLCVLKIDGKFYENKVVTTGFNTHTPLIMELKPSDFSTIRAIYGIDLLKK